MKISKNSQHLRIVVTNGLPTEFVIIIPLILFIFLCVIPLLWLLSGIDIPFAPFLYGAALLILGLTYYIVAGFGICIDVDANVLTVKKEPISLWNKKELPSKMLKLIYYEAERSYLPHSNLNTPTNLFRLTKEDYVVTTHEIYAVTNDFEEIELLSGLGSKAEALFIAQEINHFLHLEDKLAKIR